MISSAPGAGAGKLIGRGEHLKTIERLLGELSEGAAGIIVRGEAGIGKSALLACAADGARTRNVRTLRTVGVESETDLAFAGLHQLMRPILDRAERLPAPQREGLDAAFGLAAGSNPDRFLIALGAFQLVCDCADSSPLLLLVDDAQWIDNSTMDVLTFIARRLESEPVGLVVALRSEFAIPLRSARLPELQLDRLDQDASEELLDRCAPELDFETRMRVLETAEGNPLGLIELGSAAPTSGRKFERVAQSALPLTERLQQSFARRLVALPELTRAALLACALDDAASPVEVATAAGLLVGAAATVDCLEPAVMQDLVLVQENRIRFRHPLIRSAAEHSAAPARRRAMRKNLSHIVGDRDRKLWHLAASVTEPDEQLATALEEYAERCRSRGATTTSARAFERAAALSEQRAAKGRRVVRAAALAHELGANTVVRELLKEIEPSELAAKHRAHAAWLQQITDGTVWSRSGVVHDFVAIAEQIRDTGDTDLALSSLIPIALRCWWTCPSAETRRFLVESARNMPVGDDDTRILAIAGMADPATEAGVVVRHLRALRPETIVDPAQVMQAGLAAGAVGEWGLAAEYFTPAVERLRDQGRLGLLAQALLYLAWAGTCTGNWHVAAAASAETARLARDTHQPQYWITGELMGAVVSAMRGTGADLDDLVVGPERALVRIRGGPMIAPANLARAEAALGDGRHDDAFEHIWPVFNPADPVFHPFFRWWTLLEFVEAATRSGHVAEAQKVMEEIEEVAHASEARVLQLSLACARPLLATDAAADQLYCAALAQDLASWPFMRARTLLSHGEWLRRRRRIADSRRPLRDARELFDALGARKWGERARQEMRATGHTIARRGPDNRDELTPQELQIADLAARGLSNREIGERLFLSHRTIGSHLYRIFPKLGITSRAQLAVVLSPTGPADISGVLSQ